MLILLLFSETVIEFKIVGISTVSCYMILHVIILIMEVDVLCQLPILLMPLKRTKRQGIIWLFSFDVL